MKKRLLALAVSVCMMASLAACTSGSTSSASGATGSTQTSNTGAKAPDNNMVVAFNNDIQKMDPQALSDGVSITVAKTMYEALIGFDEDLNIEGVLAESWEISDDNLTYTFKLREGVKFHDGTDFNSAAFVAAYERALNDESLNQSRRVKKWASVEAPDDYTVVITLTEPQSSFLNQFTQFYMFSPTAAESGDLNKQPCGTGPYEFVERVEGDHVTVKPFADYWGETKPTIDTLTFRAVPEDGSRVAMLKTGEADIIYPMPSIQAASIDGTSDVEIVTLPSTVMRYVTLNMDVEELSDVRVRQAMNYAIDKEAYAQVVFNGYASEVDSFFSSTIPYYSAQEPYTYDLEKAKSLMKEAGYEDGFNLTLWGDTTSNEQKGMQFVQQQLAQIGITVEVLPMESNVQNDLRNVSEEDATIQMWYVNWAPGSYDADGAMRSLLHSEFIPPTAYNTAYYKDAEFDALLDKARATTDTTEMADYYAQAQALAWEAAPWLFLGNDNIIAGQKTYVQNVVITSGGDIILNNASLDV